MANKPNSKLITLMVFRILFENTDANHGITMAQILEKLYEVGLESERKKIGSDIKTLREFGFDIEFSRSSSEYRLVDRPFEIEELTLLLDTIQSSLFLTESMTNKLIKKIQSMGSRYQKDLLHKRIEVPGRIKMQNKKVFKNLDLIQQAMREKKQVTFKYGNYNTEKELVPRRKANYTHTPVKLVYADECYYLIVYNAYYDNIHPYRVDRMIDVEVSDIPAIRNSTIANYRLSEQESPSFGIFASKVAIVELEFSDETIMNPIIDKFGEDVVLRERENGTFSARGRVNLSPLFYGWLLEMSTSIKLVSPVSAVEEYKSYLRDTLSMYD